MVKIGRSVSLSFEAEDGRITGGPKTTEGLIVEIENFGYSNYQHNSKHDKCEGESKILCVYS